VAIVIAARILSSVPLKTTSATLSPPLAAARFPDERARTSPSSAARRAARSSTVGGGASFGIRLLVLPSTGAFLLVLPSMRSSRPPGRGAGGC